MISRPRVALVGCGWFACTAHLPALRRLEQEGRLDLVALCSRTQSSLQAARKLLGKRPLTVYTDLDAVLADGEIDLVDLVLPIPLMPAAIRAALQAGKHVISEKPCAPSVADGLSLLRLHAGLPEPPLWSVAENWRFKPAASHVERLLAGGNLGKIQFADFRHMAFTGPQGLGWRGSPDYPGGSLLDSGVHFVALLRRLVGEVDEVGARVSQRLAHLPPADSVSAVLSFATGAEGTYRVSFAAPHADREPGLVLVGTKGTLSVDFRRGRIDVDGAAGRRSIAVKDDPWVQGGVYELLSHCIDAVRTGAPLRSTAWEAFRDVAVIEAMLESGRVGTPVRPAALYPALHGVGQAITAYGDVWTVKPGHVVDCACVEDVRAAVRAAAAAGLHVRAMGNGQSWAAHLMTRDVCLRLGGLDRIRALDPERKTVVVEAGVRLGDLTRHLAAHGLSLPSLSFLSDASVGGAVATGTHGTSAHWGTLSDFVSAITLVVASGDVKTFRKEAPGDDFRAAIVSVGMLGVIVEIEFQAIDLPWVRFCERQLTLDDLPVQGAAMVDHYAHLWLHWTLGTDWVDLKGLESQPAGGAGFHRYVVDDNAHWGPQGALVRSMRLARRTARRLRRIVGLEEPPAPPPLAEASRREVWMSMQYGVAAAQWSEAVARLRNSDFARTHAGRVVEMKFLKASECAYLGANADGDAVLFNLWWRVEAHDRHTIFDPFETIMRDLHAKPHWGKFHRPPDRAYMEKAFRHWPAFENVRKRWDPAGLFAIVAASPPAGPDLVGAAGFSTARHSHWPAAGDAFVAPGGEMTTTLVRPDGR